MNAQRFIQTSVGRLIYSVANAAMFAAGVFAALERMVRSLRSGSIYSKGGKRGGPDDGTQGAGVTARLKPPPPVLTAAAAKALTERDGYESA